MRGKLYTSKTKYIDINFTLDNKPIKIDEKNVCLLTNGNIIEYDSVKDYFICDGIYFSVNNIILYHEDYIFIKSNNNIYKFKLGDVICG